MFQADAPPCPDCGMIMVRNDGIYKCLNCGKSGVHGLFERKEEPPKSGAEVCPACGGELINENCKIVCRSKLCVYRLVYNCSEF